MKNVLHSLTTKLFLLLLLLLSTAVANAQRQINATGSPVTENFDTLSNTGTSSIMPEGWSLSETGTSADNTYAVNNGSSNGGNTYSVGATSSSARSLGGLQSGSVIPTFGFYFQNNSGSTATSVTISYTGETWRVGTTGRSDRLDFQYSINATSLTTGTWTDFDALDYANVQSGTTITAAQTSAVQTASISNTITLTIASGSKVFIRWNDFNASGSDDVLAINDFSITLNASSNAVPVASDVTFTGTLTTGNVLTSSYTFSDADGDLTGTPTYRWFRATNGSGAGQTPIGSATASTYTLGSGDLGSYIAVGITPVATTGSSPGVEVISPYQGPVASSTNSLSTITVASGFTPTANVDYASFTGSNVTDTSFEIGRFTLNDVTGSPDDGLPTTLTALSFNVTGSSSLDKIALYNDVNSEVLEVTAASSISFPGLSLAAPSGGSVNFSIRATFKTTVTDNAQPQITISAASADTNGSLFAAGNAGGAASSIAGDDNRIEVTATALRFTSNVPTSTFVNANMAAVTVEAIDVNLRRDLDFVSQVDITSTGTLTTTPTSAVAALGVATFNNISHSATGTGLTLTASFGALTPGTSSAFAIVPQPIFANDITSGDPAASNPYTTGQTVAANLGVSGIGRGNGLTLAAVSAGRYNASGWSLSGLDANDYYEFILTPNTGYEIDFTNFVYTGAVSGSGPSTYVFRSSRDNFTANIGSPTATGTTIDLTAETFQGVSSAISFRIYAYNASNTGGTFSVNDFQFNGTIEASTTPAITALPTTISNLNYFEGSGPSPSQSFNVSGSNLTPASGNLTATASSGFEVSADNVTFGTTADVAYTGGTVTNSPVYVRLAAGQVAGDYNGGTITVSGGGAPVNALVSVSGKIVFPFQIPYTNAFTTQPVIDDAIAKGFTIVDGALNGSYLRFNANGSITTPEIDFTAINGPIRVIFEGATFGSGSGQSLSLQVSDDGGATYDTVQTINPTSSSYLTLSYDIDPTDYAVTNGRIRIQTGPLQTRFRNFYILASTTWDGNAWSNGAPNNLVMATIDGDYTTSSHPSINAYNLTVTDGDVTITGNHSITLQYGLTVTGGSVEFESNANLMQVNTAVNTGNISISRTANMRRLDYVYWSSPVTGQNVRNFSEETRVNRFYTLDESVNNFSPLFAYAMVEGNEVEVAAAQDPATYTFENAKGYMIRARNTHPDTVTAWTGTFTGIPHNGPYTIQATNGAAPAAVGFNIIGNPYPSPIVTSSFLSANTSVGTVYFWTHSNQNQGGANYASRNSTGGIEADDDPSNTQPNAYIQVGQGFLINVPNTVTINFNNGMRFNDHSDQFFRSSNTSDDAVEPTGDRLWIDLKKDGSVKSQALIGYMPNATDGIERAFDGEMIPENASQIYSVIGTTPFSIQGKAAFADTDVVPMGYKALTAGNYNIALHGTDGVFNGDQAIFLRDKQTNTLHNIKNGEYTFATEAGSFDDRFEIVYNTTTLGVGTPLLEDSALVVYKNGTSLEVNAGAVKMQSVKIYDIRGRLVAERDAVNATTASFSMTAAQQVLLVQVTSEDGKIVTKKVIF